MKSPWGFILAVILVLTALPLSSAGASSNLSWDSLQVGQVVARGIPSAQASSYAGASATGCYFSGVSGATITQPGQIRNISLQVDSSCNLYVASKTVTSHAYAPGDPTNNQVFMYDPVGLHLTQETGTATFSICGSNICISSYAENPYVFPDGWVNTGTFIDSVTFVGNPAHAAGHGNFHWLLNTYQHTLSNSEKIYVNGNVITLVCYWSYSGTIVSGVGESCYFS